MYVILDESYHMICRDGGPVTCQDDTQVQISDTDENDMLAVMEEMKKQAALSTATQPINAAMQQVDTVVTTNR